MKNLTPSYLKHQFLIAMPHMDDPHFAQTLTYIVEHNADGAMGLVINRPQDLTLADVLEQLRPEQLPPVRCQQIRIHSGGPVQTDRGFVLHAAKSGTNYTSSMSVPGGLEMTTSKDVLEAVASGTGPERFLLTLGHAGWGAGQLEEEISKNGWLTVEADPKIVFDVPAEERFEAALALLGISSTMLSGEAGHA